MPFTMDIVRGDVGSHLDRRQEKFLGERVRDTLGRTWSYVLFGQAVSFGTLMRDEQESDLIGSTVQTTSSISAGGDRLPDSNAFTSERRDRIIGASGMFPGLSYPFVVVDIPSNSDDEAIIRFLANANSPLGIGDGAPASIVSGTEYVLHAAGVTRRMGSGDTFPRGFVQQTIDSADVGKYGYVLQNGFGYGQADISGTALVRGGLLAPAASGTLVGGGTATNSVGRCLHGDVSASSDRIIAIQAEVDNDTIGFRLPSYDHPIDANLSII